MIVVIQALFFFTKHACNDFSRLNRSPNAIKNCVNAAKRRRGPVSTFAPVKPPPGSGAYILWDYLHSEDYASKAEDDSKEQKPGKSSMLYIRNNSR